MDDVRGDYLGHLMHLNSMLSYTLGKYKSGFVLTATEVALLKEYTVHAVIRLIINVQTPFGDVIFKIQNGQNELYHPLIYLAPFGIILVFVSTT